MQLPSWVKSYLDTSERGPSKIFRVYPNMTMVTMSEIRMAVYGLCFMYALTANVRFASQLFIKHTRFDRGFINGEITRAHLTSK
jgi:hypothetical protein